jgi:hypothetical protein
MDELTITSITTAKLTQKLLSAKLEDQQFTKLFANASLPDRARLLSISSPHSSAWLSVTPSPRLNLHLDPSEFQVAIKWWLGLPVSQGQLCPQCMSHSLDHFGHHALSCKNGSDVVSRHNRIRDTFLSSVNVHAWVRSLKLEAVWVMKLDKRVLPMSSSLTGSWASLLQLIFVSHPRLIQIPSK